VWGGCRYVYLVTVFIVLLARQNGRVWKVNAGLVPEFRAERYIEANTTPLGNQ